MALRLGAWSMRKSSLHDMAALSFYYGCYAQATFFCHRDAGSLRENDENNSVSLWLRGRRPYMCVSMRSIDVV